MRKSIPFFFILILIFNPLAQAETLRTSEATSLFENPTTGSKQLDILPENTEVNTSGEEFLTEDIRWIAVNVNGQHGYIRVRSLGEQSRQSMAGTVGSMTKKARLRLWLGDGLATINSNQRYWGNRLSMGGDFYFGEDLNFILGASMVGFGSPEATSDLGGLHRFEMLLSAGYFFIPDHFFAKGNLGLQLMWSDTLDNYDPGGDIGTAAVGFSVGYRFAMSKRLDATVDLSYDYAPPMSAYGYGPMTFPTFDTFSLNFSIGFDGGRAND